MIFLERGCLISLQTLVLEKFVYTYMLDRWSKSAFTIKKKNECCRSDFETLQEGKTKS